jgi:enoyl-CoA hydratase/carnithine racemase
MSQAHRLILLGETIDSEEAYRIGLVDMRVPKEKTMSAAISLARKISEKGPVSIRLAMRAMREGSGMDLKSGLQLEAQIFGEICKTEDMKEGLQAFLEHRKPAFKGR